MTGPSLMHEAGLKASALGQLKGWGGEESGRRGSDGETHVPLWLIHVDYGKNDNNIVM